ncbi:MAG TPA: endonuclease/exonuclease/phosphatase family protein [Roseiflexaceae bacterium]|nr:endonuclease/exonuclease/phosphatase family protein [Roseiflexaceae bacterium]
MAETITFTALTFNCFGGLAPGTRRRLRTLARELARRAPDVVCLQEVQLHAHHALLLRELDSYPHTAHEPFVYAPKGGLLTLSRAPMAEACFVLYPERGRWYAPTIADIALHKGALLARVKVAGTPVTAINTHLSANYRGDWRPESPYARTERAQLARLAEIVAAEPPEALVLVMGDFNVPRNTWLYEEFLARSGLCDPLAGDARPTYRPHSGIPARYALPLDWLLLRAPPLPGLRAVADLCFSAPLPLVGGGSGFLSDHIGVELTLSWEVGDSVLQ